MDAARGVVAKQIRITGKVQGVFFRKSARDEAASWGLAGWARNEEDGSVTVFVEGDETSIDAFLPWCSQGPPRAVVESVDIVDAEPTGIDGFHTW
jgi:acylphosphatase